VGVPYLSLCVANGSYPLDFSALSSIQSCLTYSGADVALIHAPYDKFTQLLYITPVLSSPSELYITNPAHTKRTYTSISRSWRAQPTKRITLYYILYRELDSIAFPSWLDVPFRIVHAGKDEMIIPEQDYGHESSSLPWTGTDFERWGHNYR
jgi:hypothetical protein